MLRAGKASPVSVSSFVSCKRCILSVNKCRKAKRGKVFEFRGSEIKIELPELTKPF